MSAGAEPSQAVSPAPVAGGASPFAAAPPPRSSSEAATAAAAAAALDQATPEAAPAVIDVPASSSSFGIAAAEAAAGAAADQATAQLPPRPSISRNDSLARAGSLALRPLPPATNIVIYGWGRNDCGEAMPSMIIVPAMPAAAVAGLVSLVLLACQQQVPMLSTLL